MKLLAALPLLTLALAACGSEDAGEPRLADREFAWCLTKPGAVGAVAGDDGFDVPGDAQAVADEGIYDNAARWAFYEAWDEADYVRHCALAYVQFDGADDDVDLAVLDPSARVPTPKPTGNVNTSDLRERASRLVPQMEERGAELVVVLQAADTEGMRRAADAIRGITGPEWEALAGAVTEPCYEDAGAAYGMTIFNWDAAANNVNRFLGESDPLLLELAADFASDAVASAAQWRDLDADACQ
ncbi:hypothetical protein [Microbacterium sp.]|uniref:hypothetical protein n=1 Tax=Microbacterium sp. TaxID=51671 RepID=UPI0031FE72D2|nr:hypothetical protein [Microbacterium sp.]